MATAVQTTAPPRRTSEPHHHIQPRYPESDSRPRRHTSGTPLQKVHSRPEDYKNKPRPSKLVEYICFDGDNKAVDCKCNKHQASPDDTRRRDQRVSLPRHQEGSESDTGYEDEDEDDSEEELTLPPTYHSRSGRHESRREHDRPYHDQPIRHSSAQPHSSSRRPKAEDEDDYYSSHPPISHHSQHLSPPENRRASAHHDGRRNSWHGSSDPNDDRFDVNPVTRHNTYNHTDSHYDSRSHHGPDSHGSASSELGSKVISEIAQHLQSHKDSYHQSKHGAGGELVNELVGEVIRKVADGSLNGDMVKDVLREVQHVL